MNLSQQIAKHFRGVYFGGNWTAVNLKSSLEGVDWKMASAKVSSLNSIAALFFHINYYISAVLMVLKGKPLNAKDKYSFDLPVIQSQEDWDRLLEKSWQEAESFALLVEELPEERLWETFSDEKYGNYYRNLAGIIEHTHYHLGQIVLIKKMLQQEKISK
jgi:uncharacterized damage-inducible protein DinB